MALASEKYISLETFRRDETGVRTPVWFVEMDGQLYFYTLADSGKIKRIRRTSRVRVAPCDMRGTVHGDWAEGQARFATEEESTRAMALLDRKYGLQKRLLNFMNLIRPRPRAVVAIKIT